MAFDLHKTNINMKTSLVTILILSAIFSGCRLNEKKSTGELKITANLGGINWIIPSLSKCNDSFFISPNDRIIHIIATIENTSNKTIHFFSWGCSYEQMFVVDDTFNFLVQSRFNCFSNVPALIKLPPKYKTRRDIMIREKKSNSRKPNNNIKIGMYYFTLEDGYCSENIFNYEKIKNPKIIWSNNLNLEELQHKIYIE